MDLDDVIIELRELNDPVLKPLRLPTDEEITEAEETLGITFHPDYWKYLLQASDVVYGVKEPATVVRNGGHRDLVPMVQAAWNQMGVPRGLLPICEDNGDYYCLRDSGEIVFWSHDANDLTGESWPDLATWIKKVWIEEG